MIAQLGVDETDKKMGVDSLELTPIHRGAQAYFSMAVSSGRPRKTSSLTNAVPLVYLGQQDVAFSDGGTLSDVAPTLLDLMHLEKPAEMTGHSLVTINARQSA